jgi:hypothetical protein
MSAECLEALETLCQWMDESGIDWGNIDSPPKDRSEAIAHLEKCWGLA